ncbi:hypothetical protein H8959_003120 [Pygathrix nigripes]
MQEEIGASCPVMMVERKELLLYTLLSTQGSMSGSFTLRNDLFRFGRRFMLRWCYLQVAIVGTCAALAPTFLIYCSLRFLSGIAAMNLITNTIMLSLAFAIRDWHILQLVVSVPHFVIFLTSSWLLESARWLIINNKPEEGLKELRKAAHRSGMKNARDTLTLETLFGAVILLANCVAPWALKYMKHRASQMLLMFLLAVCLLAVVLVPQEMQMLREVLATLGLGASSLANTLAFAHGNEVIPTIIRARAMGINANFANIAGALAPLMIILSVYSPPLPWIIYGVFPFISGFAFLLLPETRNKPLLDTIQDEKNE